MTIEIGLQALVAALLAVTIVYAVILNRRLVRLRDGREEMRQLIDDLGTAMMRAESGIKTLRRTAFEDDEALGRRIAESRTARDEIGFLVDRAEALSARLEKQIGEGRDAGRPQTAETEIAADDDEDLFAAGPASATPDQGAALAARATATAWLRSRNHAEPAAMGGTAARALR